MPDDDRPAPEDAGVDGPVGTAPEHARLIAEFAAARAQYHADRAATEPDRKKDAIDAHPLTRPRAEKRSEAEPAPAPESAPEFKLPEHLAAARARVDAAGEAPDMEARFAAAEAKEADRRRQREATDRSAEHADPPPAAKTGATGATRRRSAARRGRQAPKKPTYSPSGPRRNATPRPASAPTLTR